MSFPPKLSIHVLQYSIYTVSNTAIHTVHRGHINYIDTRAKSRHLKNLPVKGLCRTTQLCELLPLPPSLWFNSPPLPPSLCEYVYCIHVYSL
jgi:hypothetical protein